MSQVKVAISKIIACISKENRASMWSFKNDASNWNAREDHFWKSKPRPSSLPIDLSGPSDWQSKHVQRHPEKLSCLQMACKPNLSAAPAAVAVVLQPVVTSYKGLDNHTFV